MGLEVRIASPCSADWDQMSGDDRVRFCPECRRNVYNFSSMTEAEVKRLVAQNGGRLCAIVYQRRDGMLLTKDCPVGLRGSILLAARVATSALAAVMTASLSFAKPAPGPERIIPSVLLQIQAAQPAISLRVVDPAGQVIPAAEVTFRNEKTNEKQIAKTDKDGGLTISTLAKGKYEVRIYSPGFRTARLTHVVVPHQSIVKVALDVGTVGGVSELIPRSGVRDVLLRFLS